MLTGGKSRQGVLREKLHLDLYLANRKHLIESKLTEYVSDMSTRGFLVETLFHRYNVEQTEVTSELLFAFIIHKL